jgi:inner membrane protein
MAANAASAGCATPIRWSRPNDPVQSLPISKEHDMTDPSLPSPRVETAPRISEGSKDDWRSPLKFVLIAGIALATLIPNYFVSGMIAERENRQDVVETEFTRNWGPQQHVYSPVLVVPYRTAPERAREYLKIAPDRLEVVANLVPQQRKRGLFHATVYDAKVAMQGTFAVPDEERLKTLLAKDSRLLWNESFIVMMMTSPTGLRSEDRITINGVDTPWQPCLEAVRPEQDCKGGSIILANAPLAAAAGKLPFQLALSVRGTSSFNVMFAGKELDAAIKSPWRTPSFAGNILPISSSVTAQGFDAHWQTSNFGSPPISTAGAIVDAALWKGSAIGVELLEATPLYRTITRVAKYGLLFVALSFVIYFFFELLARLQIHIVQYGLLALSMSLFSLLLLSLSEPIGYTAGYVVSAALVLVQSSLYTAAVARRAVPALMFAAMQASLFAFIYVLLDLETYSLLIGTLALFAIVSVLMILAQRVNWSAQPLAFTR